MTINKVNMTVSTFKARYDSDEEFREAHLLYMQEQIICDGCNRPVTRCNLTRHKRSNLHKKHLVNTDDISKLKERKKEIRSNYNEKIKTIRKQMKAVEKEKQRELDKIDKKIEKKLNAL